MLTLQPCRKRSDDWVGVFNRYCVISVYLLRNVSVAWIRGSTEDSFMFEGSITFCRLKPRYGDFSVSLVAAVWV